MTERIFVNQDGTATIICPQCGKLKQADVKKYLELESCVRLRCRCICGYSYVSELERRKFIRKKTNFPGSFNRISNGSQGLMKVCDVSRSGLKLQMSKNEKFVPGDELHVEFRLDDSNRSIIKKYVVVRKIEDGFIGVEFKSMDHYDQLGAYLMFN
jgi:hypothetical protein